MIFEMPVRPSAENTKAAAIFFLSSLETRRRIASTGRPTRDAARAHIRHSNSQGFEFLCCLYSKRSIGLGGVPPTRDAAVAFKFFYSRSNRRRRPADTSLVFPVTKKQTGGAAIMRKGPNLLKLARKEQCLALLNSMRAKNKINGCIYRVFPSGEVQYLHPKDGVYPEKVNKGRVGVNNNMRSIGKNANPASIKFGGKLGADGLASDGAGFSRVFDQ